MAKQRDVLEFPFPVRGLNTAMGYRNISKEYSPDLANVRAFDAVEDSDGNIEGRARGGRRGGLTDVKDID